MIAKNIFRFFKILKAFVLFLLTVTIIYFLAAILFSLLKTQPPLTGCPPSHEIFIVSNGVHMDIILPTESIEPEFLHRLEIINGATFVAFGWGDKDFYINTPEWSDLTFKTAFKALFLKSETAMHVTSYFQTYSSWKRLKLCDQQMILLQQFIKSSFQTIEDGSLQKIPVDGYTPYDTFFDARGSFSIFYTCNIWVNKALKEIGVPTSVWSPFDIGILYHLSE